MLLALYSGFIAFPIFTCLRLIHYMLVDLARLMFFSIPALSLINTIQTIQY